jgi:type I restriction enzyme S subunit
MSSSSSDQVLALLHLPDGWVHCQLGDLVDRDGLSYGVVQPGSDDPQGVPIVRVQNLHGGRFTENNTMRVSREIEAKHKRTRLRGGEVLISLVGSVGLTAIAPESIARWNVARAVGVIRPTEPSLAQWIKICLSLDPAQHLMHTWKTTTVQATLNLRDVRRLPIIMPPKRLRDAITSLVTALDNKVELNEQSVRQCDDLRRLLYNNFVSTRFENVIHVPLSSTADFVNGRAFTKGSTGTGRMVIRIAELNVGPGDSTVYNDIDVPDQHLARQGDVLFAWSGSLTVVRWFREEAIINQHIFKVIPRDANPTWLIFELTSRKLDEFRFIAAGKATTMGHIQRHHLDEPVPLPNSEVAHKLDIQLRPLWDRALAAEQESLAISRLRDALLPLLMLGKVKVRNAEKAVEQAI